MNTQKVNRLPRGVLFLWLALLAPALPLRAQEQIIRLKEGSIHFISDAPLELIEATSRELQGVIDPAKGNFAFSVAMNSFKGFNSPLQREHFNENYMESKKLPNATFTGKIIEEIDFNQNGRYEIRAKGKLTVHGREQERIIRSLLVIQDELVSISSSFSVLLEEHDIDIPKIVYQKIAEEIQVTVEAVFEK